MNDMARWTSADTARAIKGRLSVPPLEPIPAAGDALMTLAKLLTGAGGAIDDVEMRSLERWLDAPGKVV